jgi:hypothetical protein
MERTRQLCHATETPEVTQVAGPATVTIDRCYGGVRLRWQSRGHPDGREALLTAPAAYAVSRGIERAAEEDGHQVRVGAALDARELSVRSRSDMVEVTIPCRRSTATELLRLVGSDIEGIADDLREVASCVAVSLDSLKQVTEVVA